MIPDYISIQIAGDACPVGLGSWNLNSLEYFSRKFPLLLQDSLVPIHVKEFLCVIIAAKKWGSEWSGKQVEIFCDNDAVCDVITYQKPKDSKMQSLLREFLHWVCLFNFCPKISKIGTKENLIADFFLKENLPPLTKLALNDDDFDLIADW